MLVVWKYEIVSSNITLILLNDGIQYSSTNKNDYNPVTDHWFCVLFVSVRRLMFPVLPLVHVGLSILG